LIDVEDEMMSSNKVYRVALVGCGDIAQTGHVPSLMKHPRFKLAALCDTRAERTELLSKMAGGVEAVSDYRALLTRSDIDAVILALHPEISVDVAIAFLRAGKPVLDEKPLAASIEDGARLVREVEAGKVVYQIGFVFGDCDMVRAIAPYAKRIGTPAIYRVGIYDERYDPANTEHVGRIGQAVAKSSAVTHEGSHVVDFVRRWNPSPYVKAQASSVQTVPGLKGPNIWATQLSMADGSLLALDIVWLTPELMPSTLSIHGPGGAMRVELATGKGEFRAQGRVESLQLPLLVQAWARQLDGFAESIDTGRSVMAPISRGWEALVATQACERSNREKKTVEIG